MTIAHVIWIAGALFAAWLILRAMFQRQMHLTALLRKHVDEVQTAQRSELEQRRSPQDGAKN